MDILSYALAKAKAAVEYIAKSVLTARGDLLYRDASGPAALAKGTTGQVLTQGENDPEWAAAGGGETSEKKMYYIRGDLPTAIADLYIGKIVYAYYEKTLYLCTTVGMAEVDVFNVQGPPTLPGENHIEITLDTEPIAVAVNGGTLDVHNATITAGASANGNITLTLNGVEYVKAVTSGMTAADVAQEITWYLESDADWTVGNINEVLTFTAKAVGPKSGTFSFAPASTGVTCTGGITETVTGIICDTAEDVAEKIEDAVNYAYEGAWVVVREGTVLTITNDSLGECVAPTFTDTDTTGTYISASQYEAGVDTAWGTVVALGGGGAG